MSLYDDKYIYCIIWLILGLSQGLSKESSQKKKRIFPPIAGDTGSILRSRRSPGGGNGNSLQYSCLGNPKRILVGYSHGVARVRHGLVTKQQQTYLMITPISL